MNRNKELAKNTLILGIGQLVPKFLAIIVLPILTTYLSTDEYGTYDLVLSFASLAIPVITIQMQQAVFRYLLATLDSQEQDKYITSSIIYILLSSAILLPICFLILLLLGVSSAYSLLICVLFFSETIYTLLGQILRGTGHNVKYSLSVIVYSTTNMILIVGLVAKLHFQLYGVIIALGAAYLAADVYMVITGGIYKHFKFSAFSKEKLKELAAFSLPIVPSSIALWIVNLSDRMVIINFLGTGANGIYAVANKVPTLYNTAYSVFNLAWTETASRVSDDGNPEEYYSDLFKGLFSFLVGVMLLMLTITPLLFKVLVKGAYGEAIYQTPILYFGVFFNSFVNFYSGIYIALKRTKQVGISSAAGAVLNLAINLLMVRMYGLYAASISTALSFLVIVLYRAYDLNKVIKIKYDFKKIAIGMICFLCGGVLLYIGNLPCVLTCGIIAIVYNIKENMPMIKKIMKKIRRN